MTAHRITTRGNSRPHIVHNGYQDKPRVPGPLERINAHRPEGEPSFLVGVGVVVFVFCLFPFLVSVFA